MKQDLCKDTLSHINRVIGQLNRLKTSIEQEENCKDIALLATSIAKSFDGVQMRIFEGALRNEIVEQPFTEKKQELLTHLLQRLKK